MQIQPNLNKIYLLMSALSLLMSACGAEDATISNAGEMNAGEMNAGEMNAGEMNAGEMNAGEMNAGEMNAGEMTAGEMNAGEIMFELPYLQLSIDRPILGQQIQGDSLSATCAYYDAEGVALPSPDDLSIHIDSENAHFEEGRWSFSSYGTYQVICSSASLGLETTQEILVHFDGVDYRHQMNIDTLYLADVYYRELINAFTLADEEGRTEAIRQLRSLSFDLVNVTDIPWIAPHPIYTWPEESELTAANLSAVPGDSAWSNTLAELSLEIEADYQWWSSLDPNTITNEDVDLLLIRRANIERLSTELSQLPVSSFTAWTERSSLGAVMRRLTETAQITHQTLIDFYENEPLPELTPGGFTLGELMTTVVVQAVLVTADNVTGGLSYHQTLKNVGLTAVASYLQVGLKELLNLNLETAEDAPVISSIHGPAGGFMGAGNSYQVFGSFPGGARHTVFMIIPPRYTQVLATIFEIQGAFSDVLSSRAIVIKSQEISRMIRLIVHLPSIVENLGDIMRSGDLLRATPSDGNDEHLLFPALPSGLNCSFFMLPAVGTVIPVSTLSGVGEAVNVNFYGEVDTACD